MAERSTALYIAGRVQVSDRAGNQEVTRFEEQLMSESKLKQHFRMRLRFLNFS